jgi:signal peptidase II
LPSLRWFLVAAAVVAVDQASKAWLMAVFDRGESLAVTPFFNLVFVFNSGAAFSFLAGEGGWQRWFFVLLALVVSVVIAGVLRRERPRLEALSLALILGGALGNVIDRLRFGAVADFLQFHAAGWYFPAFNAADSAITLGVALMLWYHFKVAK